MAGPGCRLLWLACVTLAMTANCAAVTGKHFPGVNKEPVEREGKCNVCSVEHQCISYFLPQDMDGVVFLSESCFHVDCSVLSLLIYEIFFFFSYEDGVSQNIKCNGVVLTAVVLL